MDAISILSAAMSPKSPSFVKKPEFSQEVVSQTCGSLISGTDAIIIEKINSTVNGLLRMQEVHFDLYPCN